MIHTFTDNTQQNQDRLRREKHLKLSKQLDKQSETKEEKDHLDAYLLTQHNNNPEYFGK